MIIRTISTLPKATTVNDKALMEVSMPTSEQVGVMQKYSSNSIELGSIISTATDRAFNKTSEVYDLSSETGSPISLNKVRSDVNLLSGGNITISGTKTFTNNIKVTAQRPNKEDVNSLVTVGYLFDNLNDTASFISETRSYNAAQTTSNSFVDETGKTDEAVADDIYEWNLSANTSSSTPGNSQSNEVIITQTGNLVVYGWMTALDITDTQECWIALEAFIKNRWIIISVQPWVVGQKASYMQYVGFNVLVSAGTKLRITTGVRIDTSASRYQSGKTLVYNKNDVNSNITNTFVGYVLY